MSATGQTQAVVITGTNCVVFSYQQNPGGIDVNKFFKMDLVLGGTTIYPVILPANVLNIVDPESSIVLLSKTTDYHLIEHTKTLSAELSSFSYPAANTNFIASIENLPLKVAVSDGWNDFILLDYISISEHFRVNVSPLSKIALMVQAKNTPIFIVVGNYRNIVAIDYKEEAIKSTVLMTLTN